MSELLEIVQISSALRSSGERPFSIRHQAFDRLTRLATRLCKTPVGLVSLVDRDRQFFKSAMGCRTVEDEARDAAQPFLLQARRPDDRAARGPRRPGRCASATTRRSRAENRRLCRRAADARGPGARHALRHRREPRAVVRRGGDAEDLAACVMREIDLRTRLREAKSGTRRAAETRQPSA